MKEWMRRRDLNVEAKGDVPGKPCSRSFKALQERQTVTHFD